MVLVDQLFCDTILSKLFLESKSFKNAYQRLQSVRMIDILLKYILRYEFLNNLDAQSDFDTNCHEKSWSSRTIFILSKILATFIEAII